MNTEPNMRIVTNELSVGKANKGIDLHVDVGLDGKHLFRMKCESFIGSFIEQLHSTMSGRHIKMWNNDPTAYGRIDVASVTVDGADVVVSGSANFVGLSYSGELGVAISGVTGISGVNGWYRADDPNFPVTREDYDRVRIGNLASEVTGVYDVGSGQIVSMAHETQPAGNKYAFYKWRPIIGNSNIIVKASDMVLYGNLARAIEMGSTSVSPLVTDQEKSLMTISRPFTNTGTSLLEVNEIGIELEGYAGNFETLLLARDVLQSTINFDAAKTLTLDYEVKTALENFNQDTDTNGSNGGFLEPLIANLRNAAGAYESQTYTGRAFCASFGGGGFGARNQQNIPSWMFGIRLGTNNKFVSMTDVTLNPDDPNDIGIEHGEGDGQLVYYGDTLSDYVVDDVANEAHFTISRVFENRGSTAVTVKESGLFAAKPESGNYQSQDWIPVMIARRAYAPADQFTIQPGQFVKVDFVVKAVV